MWQQLRTSFVVLAILTLLTGVIYPLLVTIAAQTTFPYRANGSVMIKGDKAIGSELIGQSFAASRILLGPAIGYHSRTVQCRRFRWIKLRPAASRFAQECPGADNGPSAA